MCLGLAGSGAEWSVGRESSIASNYWLWLQGCLGDFDA